MSLTTKEKKILHVFKREILKHFGRNVLAIRLFGSKARGDADKFSDIDVLVILRNGDWHLEDEVHKITAKILVDYEVDISAKVVNVNYYNHLRKIQAPFFRAVTKEGLTI